MESVTEEPLLETQEEREKFYQELMKAREVERKKAISDGKMDDPLVPKRLEDAITMVGTCMDMCPRFERYRRERENNLTEWESIPGTKRVDHKRAVKMYERAAGDKTLPSDLRPPQVLKRTLDYLFHDLLLRGGFHRTFSFIRDRSRAVRNDFTMQHETGELAMECHERCARFHILALHFERDEADFSIAMEEQQLMYALQSLKEFYGDQRTKYQSPNELEMRVYHRLIHIRDQKERHDDIPEHITSHPVFKLTTDFRLHVQKKSAPITKTSKLTVDAAGMEIFGSLAAVLREQGSIVMIYLVACVLERLFGKDAIDDIEAIRSDLEIPDIIDGMAVPYAADQEPAFVEDDLMDDESDRGTADTDISTSNVTQSLKSSATEWLDTNVVNAHTTHPVVNATSTLASAPTIPSLPSTSAFAGLASAPNPFGTQSVFGGGTFTASSSQPVFGSVFQATSTSSSEFQQASPGSSAPFNVSTPASESSATTAVRQPTIPVPPPVPSVIQAPPTHLQPRPSNPQAPDSPSLNATHKSSAFLNPTAPSFIPSLRSAPPLSSQPDEPERIAVQAGVTPIQLPEVAPPTSASLLSPLATWTPPASSSIPAASTPPTLPKLDTSSSRSLANPEATLASPHIPPALGRRPPISLPSTPTVVTPPTAWPHLGFLRNGNLTPTSSMSSEILSPIFLQSPTVSRKGSMVDVNLLGSPGTASSSNVEPASAPSPSPLHIPSTVPERPSSKGKGRALDTPFDKTLAKEKAIAFRRKTLVVKDCFRRWMKRSVDRAAWADAWNKSEAYREKIESERPTTDGDSPAGKRRMSSIRVNATPEASPIRKRPKRRVSEKYQAPRTDEELARRLKENQEEHERRWARGSFLQIVTTHARALAHAKNAKVPPSWRAWVSLNPESDATAIWLERKFDIPSSGSWASDSVFEIPLSTSDPSSSKRGYPGLIIFECTPLESISDEIERKYRVLDDCTRLRGVLKSLPRERHFVPSLLILSWSGTYQHDDLGADLAAMIHDNIQTSIIKTCAVFSFTSDTKDLDAKFAKSLESLTCDVEGELVQTLPIRMVFHLFDAPLRRYVVDNLDRCIIHAEFNWLHYGALVAEYVPLLNDLADAVTRLASADIQVEPLPSFDDGISVDSSSLYDAAFSWLAGDNLSDATDNIISDLQSHRSMERDFPTTAFLEHLTELIRHRVEAAGAMPPRTFCVPKADIQPAVDAFSAIAERSSTSFMERMRMRIRRSPRRRSVSMTSDISMSDQPPSKRTRMSASVNGTPDAATTPMVNGTNGDTPPSPAPSSASLSYSTFSSSTTHSPSKGSEGGDKSKSKANVTLAMLKALTKDVKMKYGMAK